MELLYEKTREHLRVNGPVGTGSCAEIALLPRSPCPRPDGAFYMLFCDSCVWEAALLNKEASGDYAAECGHGCAHPGLSLCALCAMNAHACRKCGKPRRQVALAPLPKKSAVVRAAIARSVG